jgi:hypothetical protein
MQCRSCGAPILASFKHAMAKNECPSCGGQILDEESLALIESVEMTIRSEAAVREETAHHLAMTLVAKYDIIIRDGEQIPNIQVPVKTAASRKIAPPSAMKQAMQQDIIRIPEVPDGISDKERDQIFEQAVRDKYNIVDQIQADALIKDEFNDDSESQALVPVNNSLFSEGNSNSILERERMVRLAKQQQAMNGGGQGLFRRG